MDEEEEKNLDDIKLLDVSFNTKVFVDIRDPLKESIGQPQLIDSLKEIIVKISSTDLEDPLKDTINLDNDDGNDDDNKHKEPVIDETINKDMTVSDAALKGVALLKSLLSTSTAIADKMITTTEVTDETLNLRKILYQPEKAKSDEKELTNNGHNANISDTQIDDDDRLIIDEEIPEDEIKTSIKSMPSLSAPIEEEKKFIRSITLGTVTPVSTKPLNRHHLAQESKFILNFQTFVARNFCDDQIFIQKV